MDGRRVMRPTRSPTACSDLAAVQLSLRRRSSAVRGRPVGDGLRCTARPAAARSGPGDHAGSSLARGTPAAQGTTADEMVRLEHQQLAAMNVTVRNVITSMRLISAFDWAEFFESVSFVDAILWTDNGFAAPDFATRDRYRRAIEELSRGSQQDELEVARRCTQNSAAKQEASEPAGDRRGDPGYYLIANGRVAFEQELGFRMPIGSSAPMLLKRHLATLEPSRLSAASSSLCSCSIQVQRKLV